MKLKPSKDGSPPMRREITQKLVLILKRDVVSLVHNSQHMSPVRLEFLPPPFPWINA